MISLRYVAGKFVEYIVSLVGLSLLIFFITRLLPGDPVRAAIGVGASDEAVQAYREELYLDEPLPIQYLMWVYDVFNGELGTSLRTNQDVAIDLVERLPMTIEISIMAFIIALIVGIPLGIIAGTNKDELPDHFSRVVSLIGVSFPQFWIAILLQILFVAWLGLFPISGRLGVSVAAPPHITGMYTLDSLISGQWDTFINALWHLVLPAVALSTFMLAQVTRLLRSEIIEISRENYIFAAEAYDLPTNLIENKYMFKNAFSSSLTIIGLELGKMITGAFYIELIFGLPGIGNYAVNAFIDLDMNAIVGVTMLIGVLFLTANTLVDLLYSVLDPRIKEAT